MKQCLVTALRHSNYFTMPYAVREMTQKRPANQKDQQILWFKDIPVPRFWCGGDNTDRRRNGLRVSAHIGAGHILLTSRYTRFQNCTILALESLRCHDSVKPHLAPLNEFCATITDSTNMEAAAMKEEWTSLPNSVRMNGDDFNRAY